MDLGAFSVSLAVSEITKSLAFYEKLGFEVVGGEKDQNWLILRSGTTTIGLFQGMFERNVLTFNPGWDAMGQAVSEFTDVGLIRRELVQRGLQVDGNTGERSSGPGYIMVTDPDGNPILIDQHV